MAEDRDDDGPDGWRWGDGVFLPYGDAWRGAALALEDALVEPGVLDRLVPLHARWAEPRLLEQTSTYWVHHRRQVNVTALRPDGARRLLRHLLSRAVALHEQAVLDEVHTTGTAVRWAWREAGVPTVAEFEPASWLLGTPLARRLGSGRR